MFRASSAEGVHFEILLNSYFYIDVQHVQRYANQRPVPLHFQNPGSTLGISTNDISPVLNAFKHACTHLHGLKQTWEIGSFSMKTRRYVGKCSKN